VAKVGMCLQQAISQEPRTSIQDVVLCIIWWNLRQFNNFLFINHMKFNHYWCEIILQHCHRWLMRINTCVLN